MSRAGFAFLLAVTMTTARFVAPMFRSWIIISFVELLFSLLLVTVLVGKLVTLLN